MNNPIVNVDVHPAEVENRIGLNASTNLRLKRYIGVRTSCADPYINTLMIQKVLAQPHWHGRVTRRDYAVLTPLRVAAREPVWAVRP